MLYKEALIERNKYRLIFKKGILRGFLFARPYDNLMVGQNKPSKIFDFFSNVIKTF